ncbi:MAG: HEAT repeat domain-containing protein [Phycisphaerales bacterium]|nr:MAG: HEAT repeat domain-containing protein [Phycisphaerales bacterium]
MCNPRRRPKLCTARCVLGVLVMTCASAGLEAMPPRMVYHAETSLKAMGFPTDTPEQLLKAAQTGGFFVRHVALQLLTHRIAEEAIPALKEALSDPHVTVRLTAAHLLFTLGDKTGLERMREDFAELVPRGGAPEPADPNIAKDPEAMKQWQRHRRYRIRRALEVAKVLAELGDRRAYKLTAREVVNHPGPGSRSRAVEVLAEMAKADDAVLASEGIDPVSVLCAVARSEKTRTVFSRVLTSTSSLGYNKRVRILDSAASNTQQAEAELRWARRARARLDGRLKAGKPRNKD